MIPTAEALPMLMVNELANTAQTAEKYMASVGRDENSGRWRDVKDGRSLVDLMPVPRPQASAADESEKTL